MSSGSGGLALAFALGVFGSVAVVVLVPRGDESSGRPVASAVPTGELARLRSRNLQLEGESRALRAELDRIRILLKIRQESEARDVASGEAGLTDEQRRERLATAFDRLEVLLPRLSSDPDEAYFREMQEVFRAMWKAPMDEPGPFRDALGRAEDPMMRMLLIPQLIVRDREGAPAILKTELGRTDDPDMRAGLLGHLRAYSDLKTDPETREIFLSALDSSSRPEARRIAVEALATLPSAEVGDALLEVVAEDPDPAVREVAVRELAEDPSMQGRLLEIASSDPDPRLRTTAECAVTLAGAPPPDR